MYNEQTEALLFHPSIAHRLDRVTEAATLQIASRARELRAAGRSIISLSTGEPDFPTPEHIKEAGIRAIQENFTKYTAAEGMPELREAVARKFRRDNGIETSADRIQVSSGGKHAFANAIISLVDPGDEVIIPSPYWVSYPSMIAIAEGIPRFVETTIENEWLMGAEDLANAIGPRSKVLILNTPVNPTSAMYLEEDLRALVPVIKESGIYVVVDELYEHLTFDGRRHFSIGSVPEIADQVITINGLSKAYSMTGWRIGFATGPQEVIAGMNRLQSQAVSHPSSISQRAAIEALTGPQDSIETMRFAFERRRDLVLELMGEIPSIRYAIPKAAFYLFFDVSDYLGKEMPNGEAIETAPDLCEMLLENFGVALVPGGAFGDDNAVRLSFAASEGDIREGIHRLAEGLRSIQ